MKKHLCCWLTMIALCASPALGQFVSGSDGSDGSFSPTESIEIDLALAPNATWNTPSPDPGKGVYDADKWAVVFKYTTINIPAGVTVTFHNHSKGAPVIWLTTGDVTIAGNVVLDGANGSGAPTSSYAIPGPGGFSGGIRRLGASRGFGPGGGDTGGNYGFGGGYGTAGAASAGGSVYGTDSIVPLIGGSGGSASVALGRSGGAGGGAILIASSTNIFLDSTGGISAKGGEPSDTTYAGSGAGGGIRLIADGMISGQGLLRALGGTNGNAGGEGRIRVEATSISLVDPGDPPFNWGLPGSVFPEATGPSLRVLSVTVAPAVDTLVPADPLATVLSGDVCFTSSGPVTLNIEAQNVPIGTTVTVRIVNARGLGGQVVTSTPLAGTLALSTATAEVTFIDGAAEVQLSVSVQLP